MEILDINRAIQRYVIREDYHINKLAIDTKIVKLLGPSSSRDFIMNNYPNLVFIEAGDHFDKFNSDNILYYSVYEIYYKEKCKFPKYTLYLRGSSDSVLKIPDYCIYLGFGAFDNAELKYLKYLTYLSIKLYHNIPRYNKQMYLHVIPDRLQYIVLRNNTFIDADCNYVVYIRREK